MFSYNFVLCDFGDQKKHTNDPCLASFLGNYTAEPDNTNMFNLVLGLSLAPLYYQKKHQRHIFYNSKKEFLYFLCLTEITRCYSNQIFLTL